MKHLPGARWQNSCGPQKWGLMTKPPHVSPTLAPAPPGSAIKSAKASAAQSPKNFGIGSSLVFCLTNYNPVGRSRPPQCRARQLQV